MLPGRATPVGVCYVDWNWRMWPHWFSPPLRHVVGWVRLEYEARLRRGGKPRWAAMNAAARMA